MAPRTTDNPEHSTPDGRWGVRGVMLGLLAAVVGAVGLPAVGVVIQLVQGWTHGTKATPSETPLFVWVSIWNTIWATLGIGVLATALAIPAAWTLRRAPAWWVALVGMPLLMPTYLAYSGWGLMRGPGTWLGDWLAHGSPARSLVFDKGLAVFGLALWAWPLAAFVVGAGARRIAGHLLDALDLEPGARWRKWRVVGGMLAGSIGASVGLIALVMAGSAVPLHLAQVDTYAIHLWLYLNSSADRAAIWPVTVPLLVVAGVAAWIIVRAMGRERVEMRDEGTAPDRRESGLAKSLAIAVWMLSVAAPIGLFLSNLHHISSLWGFWNGMGREVLLSVRTSAVVGAMVAMIGLAVWAIRACQRRGAGARMGPVSVGVLIASALVPGVLVGTATVAFWNGAWLPRAAGDSMWPVVLAHVARFGFVGAAAGWWLAGLETTDERGARLMLAGSGLRGWAVLCMRPQIGAMIGVGLAAMALSLHEIESTVIVQPPGPTTLAQYVLNQLHYNRNEELCAACVNIMGVGILLAGGAGWLIGRADVVKRLLSGAGRKSGESAPGGGVSGI